PIDNQHVAYTGLLHPIYAAFLAIGLRNGPALLQVGIAVAILSLTASISLRFAGRRTVPWAILLVWCAGAFTVIAATALVDLVVALIVLCLVAYLLGVVDGRAGDMRGLL